VTKNARLFRERLATLEEDRTTATDAREVLKAIRQNLKRQMKIGAKP
jgi:hypothetical protein